jgi:hypothetical protein
VRALVRRPAGAKLRARMLRQLRERLVRDLERRLDPLPHGDSRKVEDEEKLTNPLDARA